MSCLIIPNARNGKPSQLFQEMLNRGFTRDEAIEIYAKIHSPEYLASKGDWINDPGLENQSLDDNGEPILTLHELEAILDTPVTPDKFASMEMEITPEEAALLAGAVDEANEEFEVDDYAIEGLTEFEAADAMSFSDSTPEEINREKATNYKSLLRDRKASLRVVYRNLSKAEREGNTKVKANLQRRLEELKEEIQAIEKTTTLTPLINYGNQDIEEARKVLKRLEEDDGFISVDELLYHRKNLQMWKNSINLFLSKEDKITKTPIIEKLNVIVGMAANLEDKFSELQQDRLSSLVSKSIGGTKEEILGLDNYVQRDIFGVNDYVYDIGTSRNKILQYAHRLVADAQNKSIFEAKKTAEKIDNLSKKLRAKYGKNWKDVFYQKFEDGTLSSNLVSSISADYYVTRARLLKEAQEAERKNQKKPFAKYNKFKRENEIYLDPDKLLGEEADEEFKNQLINLMGEEEFNRQLEKIEDLKELYELDKESKRLYLENEKEEGRVTDVDKALKYWEERNSPERYKDLLKGKPGPTFEGYKYIKTVPSKSEWYDNQYKKIQSNPDLKEFYEMTSKLLIDLRKFLPSNAKKNMKYNTLPFVKKTMAELFTEKGFTKSGTLMWDRLLKTVSSHTDLDSEETLLDPDGEKEAKILPLRFTRSKESMVENHLAVLRSEFREEHGRDPDAIEEEGLTKEAYTFISSKQTNDLPLMLKMYSLMAISYKHKAQIEDFVKLADSVVHQDLREGIFQKGSDKQKTDRATGAAFKGASESFPKMKSQWDHFINVFYGDVRDEEGVTKTKLLTSDEKEEKKRLEKALEFAKTDEEKEKIQAQIDALGGLLTYAKVGDAAIAYARLKALGWNPVSGISNLMFGWISNMIEGAGEEFYTMGELGKAQWMVKDSVLKGITGYSTPNAKKISNLMMLLDVLKDSSREFETESEKNQFYKKLKALAPFEITKRTEYVNQAPQMIAMLMHDGLWKQFDNDGNWLGPGKFEPGEEVFDKFKRKLDAVIRKTHGNYDPSSPLKIDRTIVGRMLGMYRRWMFEGFRNRWANRTEYLDPNLGRNVKGRYWSYEAYFKEKGWGGVLGIFKNIIGSLPFLKTDFHKMIEEGKFSETDAANMRRNMMELLLLINFVGLGLMFKALADDDEENEYIYNFYFNLMLRLQTDIQFYSSPNAFEAITRQSMPVMTLVSDTSQWLHAVYKLIMGEDIITSGTSAGERRSVRESLQMLPFGNSAYRTYNFGNTRIDK